MLRLKDGYDRTRNPKEGTYRPMTAEEAKALHRGQRIPFLANDGTCRTVTINGAPKTWKRNPGRVEIPVKYGQYEFGSFSSKSDGTMERFLVPAEGTTT